MLVKKSGLDGKNYRLHEGWFTLQPCLCAGKLKNTTVLIFTWGHDPQILFKWIETTN